MKSPQRIEHELRFSLLPGEPYSSSEATRQVAPRPTACSEPIARNISLSIS